MASGPNGGGGRATGRRPGPRALVTALGVTIALTGALSVMEQARGPAAMRDVVAEATHSEGSGAGGDMDWGLALGRNPDVVGALRVPGAEVDVLVCQASKEDPTFYLGHDLDRRPSSAGTPFLDWRVGPESPHLVVYGHHLSLTGGMFSGLSDAWRQGRLGQVGPGTWQTPASAPSRIEPLCAMRVDKGDVGAQRVDFRDVTELREWLAVELARSSSRADGADGLASRATQCLSLVTCSSRMAGQRPRTVVLMVRTDS